MSDTTDNNSAKQLKNYIERIENLLDQKKEVSEDIKSVYDEAASDGYDKKALRVVIRNRATDRAERESLEAVVDTYEAAIGV